MEIPRPQLAEQPVKPGKIDRHTPLRHADIGMVCQRDARADRVVDYFRRQQAGRFSLHQQQARCGSFLEAKPVGKIDIRIEHNHFPPVLAQQDRLSHFSPAGMALTEGDDVRIPPK